MKVFVKRTDCPLCPVGAVSAYMASRGNFLPVKENKGMFCSQGPQAVGFSNDQFADHSFRIGAATTVAKVGVEYSKICMMYDGVVEQYRLPCLHTNPKEGTG